MGNQCCSASNVPSDQTTTHTRQPAGNTYTEEEQGATFQNNETKQTTVHAQMAQVDEQVYENLENEVEVEEYIFKRQLEDLRLAIANADSLKDIAKNGSKLTFAISQVELVIQFLSQNSVIPAHIREFKSELLGLYGDLQMFRSFHLRYTLDNQYFNCLNHINELTNFFRQIFSSFYKDGKYNFDGIFKELHSGESKSTFEQLKNSFLVVRDTYNQISGQNFSTLPNYLYITFHGKPGFQLWNELFPHDFEVSNKHFSELYSQHCGVSSRQILDLISLLDNANDQRVDIYQWTNFVQEYKEHLDEQGKISADQINGFAQEIQKKTRAMKSVRKSEQGDYIFPSGMRYTGDLDNENRRQGKGKLVDEDYEFQGEYLNDLPNGQGKEIRKKVVYEGQFKDGLYHGQGLLTFPNGRQYNGLFFQHQFHGQGELIGDDGIKYQGEWKQGHLDFGKIIYHDGSHYQGQLYNSFFKEGKGVLLVVKPTFTNSASVSDKTVEYIEGSLWEGDAPKVAKVYNLMNDTQCYEGEMSNWSINGKGKRIYADGTYEGELTRDQKNNQGSLTFKNGDKFTGQWLADQQLKGIYTYSKEKGHFYDGEWNNGVMEGQGKFSYTSGGVYVGQIKDGKRHGKGVYQYSNGNKYDGQWFENNQHGEGTFTYASSDNEGGDVYKGQFQNGKFHGFGHYYYKKSGKQYIGMWNDDKWCGEGKFFSADGKTIKAGIWKDDKLESQKEVSDIQVPQEFQHLILNINHQQH